MRKTNGETVKKEKRNTDFVKLIVIFSAMLVLFTFTGCLGCNCMSAVDTGGNRNNILLCENCVCNNSCFMGQVCDPFSAYHGTNCIGEDYNVYTGCGHSCDDDLIFIVCGGYTYDTSILNDNDGVACGIGCQNCIPCVYKNDDQVFGKILPKKYTDYKAKEESSGQSSGCGG